MAENSQQDKDHIQKQLAGSMNPDNTLKREKDYDQNQTQEAEDAESAPEGRSPRDNNQRAWKKFITERKKRKIKAEIKEKIEKVKKVKKAMKIIRGLMIIIPSFLSVIIGGIIISTFVIIIIMAIWCNENKTSCAWEFLKNIF